MNPFDHLPRDLTVEILSRLPSKDLCKNRCVSKSWRDLLTNNKEFISRQIQLSRKNPFSLVRRYISNRVTTEIEFTSVDSRGTIIDQFKETIDGPVNTFVSCGPLSLLCCARSLYTCNPGTRHLARVPRSGGSRLHNVGLGYLPATNEYKIVHMFEMGCEIFSFGGGSVVSSGRWRAVGGCPISVWAVENPVCASGGIYWAVSSGVWKDKFILCLDLEKEEFRSIGFPVDVEKKYMSFECVGLMGGLCVVGFLSRGMDVWRMGRGEWRVEYRVDLFTFCPKFLVPCDDGGDEILVHVEGVELVCCSVGSGSLRKVEYYKGMKSYNKPCLYYDSLVPLY